MRTAILAEAMTEASTEDFARCALTSNRVRHPVAPRSTEQELFGATDREARRPAASVARTVLDWLSRNPR
jgi:hypothetical protein